jgi:hypothetical protein
VHTTVNRDGTCPECGQQIIDAAELDPKAPWHFKLLLFALVLYLTFRFWQIGVWLLHRL